MTGLSGGSGPVRHFLRDDDLTPAEQAQLLDLADQMRGDPFASRALAGPKAVAVLLDKPSLRTRISFSVGVAELGGHCLVIDMSDTHQSRGEPIADTARVLSRQVAAVAWRTYGQDRIAEFAAASSVPVINALTDEFHPCQVLADLLTVRSSLGRLAGIRLTFVGDGGCNMAHSYLLGGATAGMHVRIGAPPSFWPDPEVVQTAAAIAAQTGGSAEVLSDPATASKGADVLATDTWTSMGNEDQERIRTQQMRPFQLNAELLALAEPGCKVLHCLPAHRGEEITAEVLDGPASLAWDQAENRRHVQKALLAMLTGSSR